MYFMGTVGSRFCRGVWILLDSLDLQTKCETRFRGWVYNFSVLPSVPQLLSFR